jgi:hypothetical protein
MENLDEVISVGIAKCQGTAKSRWHIAQRVFIDIHGFRMP